MRTVLFALAMMLRILCWPLSQCKPARQLGQALVSWGASIAVAERPAPLRAVIQDPSVPASSGVTNTLTAPASSVDVIDMDGSPATQPSLIAGTEIAAQDSQQVSVEVFEQDNVDGTICDCGEIPSAGGGFSKWWLLALVPLVCVTGICNGDDCEDCPPPPPQEPPIPEPATLLLLGSGLAAIGAGARRRYAKARGKSEASTTEEV